VLSVSTYSLLAFGFVLGLKHAVEADHIAAVSTIAIERRNVLSSSLVGALWGLGHTISLLITGVAVMLLHYEISDRVRQSLELCVGSAALMLLTVTTISAPLEGMFYIAIFGIGSMGGMMIMSTLVSLPAGLTAARYERAHVALRGVSGLLSVSLGLFTMYEISIVNHLFTS
jgi:sulfite exporter TauE/SafE